MNIQLLAAILLIASFVVVGIAFPFGVPGYYQTQDIAERARLVEEYRTRANINNSLLYIWSLLSAAGVGVLATYLRRNGASLAALLGALSLALGSAAYALVIYMRDRDMLGFFLGKYPDYHGFGNWFVLIGLLLLGVAFLQAGLPTWLSYLIMGAAVVLALVLLIWPAFFFMIPFLEMGLLLVIGIAALRQYIGVAKKG